MSASIRRATSTSPGPGFDLVQNEVNQRNYNFSSLFPSKILYRSDTAQNARYFLAQPLCFSVHTVACLSALVELGYRNVHHLQKAHQYSYVAHTAIQDTHMMLLGLFRHEDCPPLSSSIRLVLSTTTHRRLDYAVGREGYFDECIRTAQIFARVEGLIDLFQGEESRHLHVLKGGLAEMYA